MRPAHSASRPALKAQLGGPPAADALSLLLVLGAGVLLSRQTVLLWLHALWVRHTRGVWLAVAWLHVVHMCCTGCDSSHLLQVTQVKVEPLHSIKHQARCSAYVQSKELHGSPDRGVLLQLLLLLSTKRWPQPGA